MATNSASEDTELRFMRLTTVGFLTTAAIAALLFFMLIFSAYHIHLLRERVEALEAEVTSRAVPETSLTAVDLNKALCMTLNASLAPSDRQKCD